jgi:hypothetical protein
VDSTIVCGIISSLGHPLTSITIGLGDDPQTDEGKSFFGRGIPYMLRLIISQMPRSKPHNTTLSRTKE